MAIGTGEAILASTGANILAGAFGGNGSGTANLNLRRERTQRRALYELARDDWRTRTAESYKNQVNAAKAAGLHPLFAMGAGSGPGQSPSFSTAGQPDTGSFAKNAMQSIGAGFANIAQVQAEADLAEKQNEAAKLAIATQPGNGNDGAQGLSNVVLSKVPYEKALKSQPLAEYKPAEIGSHEKGNKTATGSVWSPTSRMRIGEQEIYTMAQEGAEIAEDPVVILGAAMLDKNNRHVDWKKAIRDYTGMSHPRPYKGIHDRGADVRRTKEYLWGLLKLHKYYQRTWGQGR